ncbi:oligo-1,6-glucosidase [Pontibacillus halophilus JSM 076056 = DSM 19796]|uniref:Alpha-amylase n=1 Tax=Pontibacillus halophilus JSM 076056 = DSM 19796 TaxID=1385510 RepID=A0A0A5I9S6_9BACI|nr:alpha-glucosidase [Pontibacillus halophilus]KGX92577.1 oligo-1,6-glucosidase [Pontibacillus halophilus JSM 076056 = DSM 19796]
MKKQWWKEAVAYQIYPRSFRDSNGDGVGDLRGVIQQLDYLKDLGIDVIWICPIFESPNDDNGYDISNYRGILQEFGTMEDFDLLLKEVHKRGMKLILDLVINHTSDEHPWFIESRASKDSPKRDWYIWKDANGGEEPNNWESIFSGSAWEYDEETSQYYLHLFSKKQPDLNWENEEVREELYSMVNWWLDKGIDGFRIDAISHIKKRDGFPDLENPKKLDYVPSFDMHMNQPGIDSWLRELSDRTFEKYDIMTVGEANGVEIEDAERWVGEENGYFDMIFQFEHLGLWDKSADGGVDVLAIKEALSRWQDGLEGIGWNALFFENHDQPRSVSTIGNDTTYWKESSKMLGAIYFFMKGTPFIYQGQEIGMTNVHFESIEDYDDVGMKNFYYVERQKGRSKEELMTIIRKQIRDNSRTPMQWNDGHMAGFTEGNDTWIGLNPNYKEVNVAAQQEDKNSILSFYKSMIYLRKHHEEFVYGEFELLHPEHETLVAYKRKLYGKEAVVYANFSDQPLEYETDGDQLVLSNYDLLEPDQLQPYEVRVYINS